MALIYVYRNTLNGKCYVGQTTRSIERRDYEHRYYAAAGEKQHFRRAIRKYGIDAFTLYTVYYPKGVIDDAEIATIKKYNSIKNGYNETEGGKSRRGYEVSIETRKKISKANTGQRAWNKGLKMPDRVGDKNYMYGRNHTLETRVKMSSACKGKNVGKDNPNARMIELILPDGNSELFDTITQAANRYGLTRQTLSKVAKRKLNHHKGYKCHYVDEEI